MNKYLSILFLVSLCINGFIYAQESEKETSEDSKYESLLL